MAREPVIEIYIPEEVTQADRRVLVTLVKDVVHDYLEARASDVEIQVTPGEPGDPWVIEARGT